MPSDLTFSQLTQANKTRVEKWHPGFPGNGLVTDWSGSDWSNAMAGECGEACNVVKKLRRAECGLKGTLDPLPTELLNKLGDEIADTLIYADLLAQYYGIDLPAAIVRKFNAVSEREGFPDRLEVGNAE